MASLTTPVKVQTPDCAFCFKADVTTFKLSGKKCASVNLMGKLDFFFNDRNIVLRLIDMDASICRTCFAAVGRFSDFQSSSLRLVKIYLENEGTCTSTKRCMHDVDTAEKSAKVKM